MYIHDRKVEFYSMSYTEDFKCKGTCLNNVPQAMQAKKLETNNIL